jgi:predicted lipoprotein with Yx(FWY)xxD motif
MLMVPTAVASAGAPNLSTHSGAVVTVESGPYGKVLVLGGSGAGPFPAGSSLYVPSIDPPAVDNVVTTPYQAGCTTTLVSAGKGKMLSCTGPETDRRADWPAFTTSGRPVAGPGVNPYALGAVYRADLGTFHVTYAGHPLYLFDGGPHSFFGANFYETVSPLPPWHTAWFLMNPAGIPAPGPAHIEAEAPHPGTTYSTTELATEMLPALKGGVAVSVHSFSRDSSTASRCSGSCARDLIPLETVGPPTVGAGVSAASIGTVTRPDGAQQVTYGGRPLYIYSQEQPLLGAKGPVPTGTAGNGSGTSAYGGTSDLVSP